MDSEDEGLLRGLGGRRSQTSPARKVLLAVAFLLLTILVVYLLLIAVLSPILWTKYNSAIAQNSLNAAVITFDRLLLKDPTATSVTVVSTITLSQTGSMAATLHDSIVDVRYQGDLIGTLTLPSHQLNGDNVATTFEQESTLNISSAENFKKAARSLLSGETISWRLTGQVQLTVKIGLSLTFDLRLDKEVLIPGKALTNLKAYDIQIVKGINGQLVCTQTQSFNNPSITSMENLGNLIFELSVPNPAKGVQGKKYQGRKQVKSSKRRRRSSWMNLKEDDDFLTVGHLTIFNFSAPQGPTTITNTSSVFQLGENESNNQALVSFLSDWTMGIDQTIRLTGPKNTSTGSEFLLDILDVEATVIGNPDNKLIVSVDFGETDLTAIQLAHNPLDVAVNQSNFHFDLSLDPSVFGEGQGVSSVLALFGNHSCPSSTNMGKVILVEPLKTIPAHQNANLTVQIDSNFFGYCDGARMVSVCCLLAQNGRKDFKATVHGQMTTQIGGFTFQQQYSQEAFPISCHPNLIKNYCDLGFVSNVCNTAIGDTC
eukprot:TRINITY_DN4664_c0_g1_i1.p1 TRINITY_DN4664_c0_g1~~TRINITY_DN4664_c0_g1_i1.p1  ORF type:complete len:542 (-),score=103.73 TRINITY_DN4664_c0_g1_i1:105-1730(-)